MDGRREVWGISEREMVRGRGSESFSFNLL